MTESVSEIGWHHHLRKEWWKQPTKWSVIEPNRFPKEADRNVDEWNAGVNKIEIKRQLRLAIDCRAITDSLSVLNFSWFFFIKQSNALRACLLILFCYRIKLSNLNYISSSVTACLKFGMMQWSNKNMKFLKFSKLENCRGGTRKPQSPRRSKREDRRTSLDTSTFNNLLFCEISFFYNLGLNRLACHFERPCDRKSFDIHVPAIDCRWLYRTVL